MTAAPVRTACYVHTPFCAIKCAYCSFFSHEREGEQGARYFEGLEAELAYRGRVGTFDGRCFDTLYVGGARRRRSIRTNCAASSDSCASGSISRPTRTSPPRPTPRA